MLKLKISTYDTNQTNAQHLIQAAIETEIKRLQRALARTNKILETFEKKYHVTSDVFFLEGTAEDLDGGDEEYISWLGEQQIKYQLIASIQQLESIEYVAQ